MHNVYGIKIANQLVSYEKRAALSLFHTSSHEIALAFQIWPGSSDTLDSHPNRVCLVTLWIHFSKKKEY